MSRAALSSGMAGTRRQRLVPRVLTALTLLSLTASCSETVRSAPTSTAHHERQFEPGDVIGMKLADARKAARANGYTVRVQHLSNWSPAHRKTLPRSTLLQPPGTVVTWGVCPDDCSPAEHNRLYLVLTP